MFLVVACGEDQDGLLNIVGEGEVEIDALPVVWWTSMSAVQSQVCNSIDRQLSLPFFTQVAILGTNKSNGCRFTKSSCNLHRAYHSRNHFVFIKD
jgi:hypothetical protein